MMTNGNEESGIVDKEVYEVLKPRIDRFLSAVRHPFTTNSRSPEGKTGFADAYWALLMIFRAYTIEFPEKAYKCFAWVSIISAILLLFLLLSWIF